MKTTKTFENASLVSVINGSIVVKSAAGIEHTFTNASVVSVNNGTIVIETEWEPKVGELIKLTGDNTDCYCIYRQSELGHIYDYGYKKIADSTLHTDIDDLSWCTIDVTVSPVTPEEQKEFDNFCKSKGKIWNKEKLQWEKYRWKPNNREIYYMITANGNIFSDTWVNISIDYNRYMFGNCFQTRKEAEKAAEEVKKLLNSL